MIKNALNFIITPFLKKARWRTCLLYHDLYRLDSEQVIQEIEADSASSVEIVKRYKTHMPNVLISYEYSGGDEIRIKKGKTFYISEMPPIEPTDEYCQKECIIKICKDKKAELPYITDYTVKGIKPGYAEIVKIIGEKINDINKQVAIYSKLEEPNSVRYVKIYNENQVSFLHNSLVEQGLLDSNLPLFLYYFQISNELPDGNIHLNWKGTNALLSYLIGMLFKNYGPMKFPDKESNFIFERKGLKSSLSQTKNNQIAKPQKHEIIDTIIEQMRKISKK